MQYFFTSSLQQLIFCHHFQDQFHDSRKHWTRQDYGKTLLHVALLCFQFRHVNTLASDQNSSCTTRQKLQQCLKQFRTLTRASQVYLFRVCQLQFLLRFRIIVCILIRCSGVGMSECSCWTRKCKVRRHTLKPVCVFVCNLCTISTRVYTVHLL